MDFVPQTKDYRSFPILLSSEITQTRENFFNGHNMHVDHRQPTWNLITWRITHCFNVNEWVDITAECVVGPIRFLTLQVSDLLSEGFPELLSPVYADV
ncbi:hypothetical protein TNIN_268121 [Trichonephila inaurata madagascariensis]|uniref:Uncharacterized protein n=1 Tax=Trichonephila inaurata madagascariensis TaxID=2747483 RepID=A0A8X6YG90_9ARAC|nr:hypothetical protein TNIN_32571 [Trichonephila inaurata madagascariensis]GFY70123.1 hypothetical protein TNIN_268121 [Trichonephila inaurata madagascariensis]